MTPSENNLQALRIIGTPMMMGGRFILEESASLGKECGWICPRCGNEVRICPSVAGEQTFSCCVCDTPFNVTVDNGAADAIASTPQASPPALGLIIEPVEEGEDGPETVVVKKESDAFLQWGGLFSRKRYTLKEGANLIGRKDKKTPSDLEFDDPEMSRRSISIDAKRDGNNAFAYTLYVLKALNPVKVNGKDMEPGVSLKLQNGDSITLGKTSLTFKSNK